MVAPPWGRRRFRPKKNAVPAGFKKNVTYKLIILVTAGILGIEPTCGESEIRKAYFKKSKEYHPDKHAVSAGS